MSQSDAIKHIFQSEEGRVLVKFLLESRANAMNVILNSEDSVALYRAQGVLKLLNNLLANSEQKSK